MKMTDETKFELKGSEELSKKFDKVTKELKSLEEEKNKLFSPTFMAKYTQFRTFNEMVEKSSFKVESKEDFENIPDEEWDIYVKEKTSFQSWNEMMNKSGEEVLGKKVQQIFSKVFKK